MSSKGHSFLTWKRRGRTCGRVRSFNVSRQEMMDKDGPPSSSECWASRCCSTAGQAQATLS